VKLRSIALFLICFTFISDNLIAQQGDLFVFSQLRFEGDWDPYPGTFQQIMHYLENTTSVRMYPERRELTLSDGRLFFSPFILLTGRGRIPSFTDGEIDRLRRYLEAGGLLIIDSAGSSEFEESADREMKRLFPGRDFSHLPAEHAVYRSFYLINYVSGRRLLSPHLSGLEVGGRTAVIKSSNDLFGIWPRDAMGNWTNPLTPGRHDQRKEAVKLSLNLIMYSVTGTYKSDPVHQPYIMEKLGR